MNRDELKQIVTDAAAKSLPALDQTAGKAEAQAQEQRRADMAWRAVAAVAAVPGVTPDAFRDLLETLGLFPCETPRRIPAGCAETVVNYERPGH